MAGPNLASIIFMQNISGKPLVSILMATYNRAGFLPRAIRSVLNQSYQGWELLVADDGSVDETKKTVEELAAKDARIRYLWHSHTGRIAVISNFGLRRVQGKYVAVLDDDDYWIDADKLSKQVGFLENNPEYAGCGGGIMLTDQEGRSYGGVKKPESDQAIRKNALIANPMANSTTLFRYDAAKEIGFYDESLLQFADWDFWLKMNLIGKLYNFPEYFGTYTMWSGGSSFKKQRQAARSGLTIIFRYRGKYGSFWLALLSGSAYFIYAYLPNRLKSFWNPILSRLKKKLFAGK